MNDLELDLTVARMNLDAVASLYFAQNPNPVMGRKRLTPMAPLGHNVAAQLVSLSKPIMECKPRPPGKPSMVLAEEIGRQR